MAMKGKERVETRPEDASRAIGYGWSSILSQLMGDLDRPVRNTDAYRSYYKQMMEEDETVGTALELLAGNIAARIGAYTHEDPKIKDLVDKCIENIRGTMTHVRREVLRDSFAFGYGVAELSVEERDGLWLLSSMPTLDPTSVELKVSRGEDGGHHVASVVQKGASGQDVEIPAWKCLIKTHGGGYGPYGQSLLRRCYRWWAFKRAVPKLWAVALERHGMPLLHGTASDERTARKLEEALAGIASKAYIVTDTASGVAAVSAPGAGVSGGYIMADELCDKKIYRAMFLPSLLASGENGGSYSLGKVHLGLFEQTARALAADYADAELEQVWRPLIEWNFGPQDGYGEIQIADEVGTEDKRLMTAMLADLAGIGAIDPETDRAWIRETLGLPDVEEGAAFPQWSLERGGVEEEG